MRLAQALLMGGGVFNPQWSMTAGTPDGGNTRGYVAGAGSITNEPISGYVLDQQYFVNSLGYSGLAFDGPDDLRPLLNLLTFYVDGTGYTLESADIKSYNSGTTVYRWDSGGPVYSVGNTYICEIR